MHPLCHHWWFAGKNKKVQWFLGLKFHFQWCSRISSCHGNDDTGKPGNDCVVRAEVGLKHLRHPWANMISQNAMVYPMIISKEKRHRFGLHLRTAPNVRLFWAGRVWKKKLLAQGTGWGARSSAKDWGASCCTLNICMLPRYASIVCWLTHLFGGRLTYFRRLWAIYSWFFH